MLMVSLLYHAVVGDPYQVARGQRGDFAVNGHHDPIRRAALGLAFQGLYQEGGAVFHDLQHAGGELSGPGTFVGGGVLSPRWASLFCKSLLQGLVCGQHLADGVLVLSADSEVIVVFVALEANDGLGGVITPKPSPSTLMTAVLSCPTSASRATTHGCAPSTTIRRTTGYSLIRSPLL